MYNEDILRPPPTDSFAFIMTKRLPFESPYLYGLHDAGGEQIMLEMGITGWIVLTEAIGYDPQNMEGKHYDELSQQGLSVMVRLNAGYAGTGTIPKEEFYEYFAQRCANFVAASSGAHIWIIGNEPNHPIEWPGADWDWGEAKPRSPESVGEPITPARYARAYLMVRDAIHEVEGHEDDLVLTAAIAPWNALCIYPGNPTGDWLIYLKDMLRILGPERCDGITLHAYTHGADPNLIDAEIKMQAPYKRHRYEFRVYQDFMNAIPWDMRHLPVYLTEADQNEPWRNENIDWVKRAYGEIDYWNKRHPFRPIRALVLYRWAKTDQWYIEGKQGVIEDFRESMTDRYRWDIYQEKAPAYRAEIHVLNIPDAIPVGETFTVTVAIRNIGSAKWKKKGTHSVSVGYRWQDNTHKEIKSADFRTLLPHDVEPGEWVEVKLAVGAPSIPGKYLLIFDLIHGKNIWFGDGKSRVARRTIRVTLGDRGKALDAVWRYLQRLKEENKQLKRYFLGLEGPAQGMAPDRTSLLAPSFSGGYLGERDEIVVSQPPMLEVVDLLPRLQPMPKEGVVVDSPDDCYKERDISQITHIAVHHSAAPGSILPSRIASYHVHSYRWPGIGYHFYITPNGTIYHTQDINLISWHVYRNNSYTVGICLAGNFMRTVPPAPQLDASARLIAWLMQELRIPIEYVLGHKEFPKNATACPGNQWTTGKRWKKMLIRAIQNVQNGKRTITPKSFRHYVLFWKHENDWAKEDWMGAAEYIARFDAVAGFSIENAHLAELVTIVGGPAGVSRRVEAQLRADGCQVQRVAGNTPAETTALLLRLAQNGQEWLRI